MVDEEARRIREEVIRALAEEEARGGGDADTAADAELAKAPAGQGVGAPLPNDSDMVEGGPEAAFDAGSVGCAPAPGTGALTERELLAAIFEDVRAQSAAGRLVEPTRWAKAGLVPEGQTADDWEMFVYEYLEEREAERAEQEVLEPAAPVRTATRTVGVPRMLRAEEPEEPEEAAESDEAAVPEESETLETAEAEASDEAGSVEAAPTDGPAPSDGASEEPPCDDIVALVGKHSYYLYSADRMTDAYARWSFLANEDDRVLTFVECVRDESKKYPRPMEAASLSNEPFNLSREEIDELWQTVRDSGAYPDLDTVTASNGDVYYFSTEYLTPAYAASLAEWSSVERGMFL